MASSIINKQELPTIDILIEKGLYFGIIWQYGMSHYVGPADTEFDLKHQIMQRLQDLRLIADIKCCQDKSLSDLQVCLYNYKNDYMDIT